VVTDGESTRTVSDLGDGEVIALPFREVCWPPRSEFAFPDMCLTGVRK
jgi:hypothetical protein